MLTKKLIALNTTLLFILGITFTATDVHAETNINQIEEERSDIQDQIKEAEQIIEELDAELKQLTQQIERVDKAIADNEQKIEDTKKEIEQINNEITELEQFIVEKEEEIEKRFEIIKQRAQALQKNGGNVSYLEVIFGSKSFGEFIDRVALVSKIVQADSDLLNEQEKAKAELEHKQNEMKQKLDGVTDRKIELEGMQDHILEQKEQNGELKKELSNKRQSSLSLKLSLQSKDRNLSAQIEALRNPPAPKQEIEQFSTESSRSSDDSDGNESNSNSKPKPSSNPTPVAASGNLNAIIAASSRYFGNSVYVFGGGRNSYDIANGRFDCSGYLSWAFSQIGMNLPASTSALVNVGKKVSPSELRPGDLVFFNTYKTNGHVGIYVGGGKFLGSQSSTGVAYASMNSNYWSNRFTGHVRRVMN